jgi:phospholipid-translocating ATPase
MIAFVCAMQCGLDMSYWTGINHFFLWGSIAVYFALTLLLYSSSVIFYPYDGVAVNVWSTASFWFTALLCCVILLFPVVAERFYCVDFRPTLADRVRLRQRIVKLRARAGDRVVRRASTLSRGTASRRSVGRSGYAFAHQQGFGELITSGSMMTRDINDEQRSSQSQITFSAAASAAAAATMAAATVTAAGDLTDNLSGCAEVAESTQL